MPGAIALANADRGRRASHDEQMVQVTVLRDYVRKG